jgi:hypothetical protein
MQHGPRGQPARREAAAQSSFAAVQSGRAAAQRHSCAASEAAAAATATAHGARVHRTQKLLDATTRTLRNPPTITGSGKTPCRAHVCGLDTPWCCIGSTGELGGTSSSQSTRRFRVMAATAGEAAGERLRVPGAAVFEPVEGVVDAASRKMRHRLPV